MRAALLCSAWLLILAAMPLAHSADKPAEPRRVKWEYLDFGDDRRQLTKVRLIVGASAFSLADERQPAVDVTSDDAQTLAHLKRAFQTGYCPLPKALVGAAGSSDYGRLEVTTNEDRFVIYLFEQGFYLDNCQCTDNHVISWTLGQVLDDLHFKASGKHFTEDQMKTFSGEKRIEIEKKSYKNHSQP